MGHNHHHHRRRYVKTLIVILMNMLILVTGVTVCWQYTLYENRKNFKQAQDAFCAMVASTALSAYQSMLVQQEVCNNWAIYIERNNYTVGEAEEFIRKINSNEEVMCHLISAEVMTGYSSIANRRGNHEVSYRDLENMDLEEITAPDQIGAIRVSNMYANPINGMDVVGFVNKIAIPESVGGEKRAYYLIRVVSVDELKCGWAFPRQYEKAEMSLITQEGSYIVRSKSLRDSNFWDFLRTSNRLDAKTSEDIATQLKNTDEVFVGKDAFQKDMNFSCERAMDRSDWYFVGCLPVDAMSVSVIDWMLIFIVVVAFSVLFVLDGFYILTINKKLVMSMRETIKANQAKTRFLSSMSHDIRTPMNAIIGMTAIAERNVNDPGRVNDCLKKIKMSSKHLLTLVNDILDISKIESGKMTLNLLEVSLAEIVTNIINITRESVRKKELKFRVHISDILYENVVTDELRLNQILINLISNAIKYTPEKGSVTFEVNQEVSASEPDKAHITFVVQDNGIGMDKEFQKTMYENFVRAVDTRIDKIEGFGLGLSITKQLVDLMGGTIECESELGQGTKFTVRLALALAKSQVEARQWPGKRILLIDDNEKDIKVTKGMLESMQISTTAVTSGEEAVAFLAERKGEEEAFSGILVNWHMPGMNGIETTREMRKVIGQDVPVMLFSSGDYADIMEEASAAGVNIFANLPFFRSVFYNKLKELLEGADQGDDEKSADEKEFAGCHLLVAEDNDLNWEIIEDLLACRGITSERAENGKICVEKYKKAPKGKYDAIIMDVQMPIMNGKAATREIRQLKNDEKRNVLIIAMTADAFAEDVKDCLDAGMNGHVAKPINMDKLFSTFRKLGLKPQDKYVRKARKSGGGGRIHWMNR